MKKSSLAEKAYIASKLIRIRPVIAWSVTSFVLVLSAGIRDGLSPDYTLALLSLLMVAIMQGLSSHAINDIADEKVDRSADMKGTGRHKLLVAGEITKRGMSTIFVISLIVSLIICAYIYSVRGIIILAVMSAGVFFIYSYNFKPLKLNYRPFAEFTTVFPVIISMSLCFSYSIFGGISNSIIYVAVVNAFMNMSWYHFSRLQDIKPDMINRKVTSLVWVYENFGRRMENVF
ncbi:MAG: prenyltransferase, partial [Coriobacteriia bacterium]|nr:prenyltransferase [Coriobacteriia bacterium]